MARTLRIGARALAAMLPQLRIPYRAIADFSEMLDERDIAQGAYEIWKDDPLALVSLMDTPAAISLRANLQVAVLVIDPSRDQMVCPEITRGCYKRLGGPKAYREIPFGHFSLQDEFCDAVVTHAHAWFCHRTEVPEI